MEVELETLFYSFVALLIIYAIAVHAIFFQNKIKNSIISTASSLVVGDNRSYSPSPPMLRPIKKKLKKKLKDVNVQANTTDVRREELNLSNPCQRLVHITS